jgi:hypothetical protein
MSGTPLGWLQVAILVVALSFLACFWWSYWRLPRQGARTPQDQLYALAGRWAWRWAAGYVLLEAGLMGALMASAISVNGRWPTPEQILSVVVMFVVLSLASGVLAAFVLRRAAVERLRVVATFGVPPSTEGGSS